MIDLMVYMQPVDACKEICVNVEFAIDDIIYHIIKDNRGDLYYLADKNGIYGAFQPSGSKPTYKDVYKFLDKLISNTKTLGIGDIIYDKYSSKYYMISRLDLNCITLVSLNNGNYYHKTINVKDIHDISLSEISELLGTNFANKFDYVGYCKDILKVKEC